MFLNERRFFMKYSIPLIVLFLFSCKKNDIDLPVYFTRDSALVLNGGENSISVINTKNFSEKSRFLIENNGKAFAHHIYFSSDRNKLAVALPEYDFSNGHNGLHGSNVLGGIAVIDVKANKTGGIFPVSIANHNAIFSIDGKEIWTSLVSHSGKIAIYNSENYKLIKEIPVGPDPSEVIFASNGTLAFVACGETSFLTVIDTQTKEIIKEIKVDPFPTNVWPGWSQNIVFVENGNQKTINIIDLDSFKVIDYIDFDFVPGFMIFNSLTSELWVCAPGINKLKIFEKTDSVWKLKNEIETDRDPHQIGFINNLTQAIVINQKGNTAQLIDVKTLKVIKKINVGLKPNGIVIWE